MFSIHGGGRVQRLPLATNEPLFISNFSPKMSHPDSHSEAFGLKGQDKPGFPTEVAGQKEGAGVLGGAGHPAGAHHSDAEQNVHDEGSSGLQQGESTVGGMKQGTSDNSVPGAGGSLMPSQGSGQVAPDKHSTGDILNPAK